MRIACLHTADSNVDVFETAAAGRPVVLTHTVRSELLREAEAAGGLTAELQARTVEALRALADGVDGVLLTCSTLGPAADVMRADASAGALVLRVDAALARQSVRAAGEGKLMVLYAVETTRAPTQGLFEAVEGADPKRMDYRIVSGAWDQFRAGNESGYLQAIATAADAAYEEGAAVVALAQSSMANAARLARKGTPLTSPGAGLEALIVRLTEQTARRTVRRPR